MNAVLAFFLCFVAVVVAFSLNSCSEADVPVVIEERKPDVLPSTRVKEKTDAETFAESDADGDGQLSSDELPAKYLLEWDLIDVNADGFIDADEQYAYLNPRGSEVLETKTTEEPQMEKASETERKVGGIGRILAENDADGDGRISMAEAPEKMQERFSMLDANGDGFFDAEEQASLVKRAKGKAWKQRRQADKRGGKGGGFGGFPGFDPGNFGGAK